jgi:hypothetical protein
MMLGGVVFTFWQTLSQGKQVPAHSDGLKQFLLIFESILIEFMPL